MKTLKSAILLFVVVGLTLGFYLTPSADSANNLTVTGTVTQNSTSVGSGFKVTIDDITQSESSSGANLTQADGSYINSIFVTNNSLVEDDQIKTTVFSKDGTTELGSKTQTAPRPQRVQRY